MSEDPALAFLDANRDSNAPGTHVLLIGVGRYSFGKGPDASVVAGDLRQLSSPPVSIRALADWFVGSFDNPGKPLHSLALVISEATPQPYAPKLRPGAGNAATAGAGGPGSPVPPTATLEEVKRAAAAWAARLRSHPDNMAVFCFCGHGVSVGQKAALLLDDFGEPGKAYEGAIDVELLLGTMKNCPAIQQVYLLDCCRTGADSYYENEPSIGSRILSLPSAERGHAVPEQQFVLFPTLDGEEAFGVRDQVSVFTRSILDAVSCAAADPSTGSWWTNTGGILTAVDRLVRLRVPPELTTRAKPNAANAVSFEFNRIPEPTKARSFVTISDLDYWNKVRLSCINVATAAALSRPAATANDGQSCWSLEIDEGRWRFTGSLPTQPPSIRADERFVRAPVAYVKLEVEP